MIMEVVDGGVLVFVKWGTLAKSSKGEEGVGFGAGFCHGFSLFNLVVFALSMGVYCFFRSLMIELSIVGE